MKIKRLNIVGFKSFVDKVSLDFEQGVTGVVGPNGCGKSNIVDAIRWAMGEQNARHLRGRMMEDVIFGGSESRKPHGMAEVTILFDNREGLCPAAYREYAEIAVTRRLYRNGDSEYLINKTPCRLLDITELFMDTGVGARAYSIIEQGKVGMLVSAKPEERRALIEEAAGVTKFKARKKTALRKMDATKQNLVRLGDIITEVRRQMGGLKRQAQRAEKYRQYRNEARQIELVLAGNRMRKLAADIELITTKKGEQATVLARLDTRLEEGDLQLEEQQLQLARVEADHKHAQEQVYHLGAEVQRVENERILVTRQREHLAVQDREITAELKRQDERQIELDGESQQLQRQQDESTAVLEQLQQQVESLEETLQVSLSQEQQINCQFEECRKVLMDVFAQTSRLTNRDEEIDRQLTSEAQRRQLAQTDSQKNQQQQNELHQQRARLLERINQIQQQQNDLIERGEELAAQQEEQKQLLRNKEADLDALRHQLGTQRSIRESLHELQANLEGYGDGTKILLTEKLGETIFADLLNVPVAYETVVEVVLEQRLQAIPLAAVNTAETALKFLADRQARATVLLPEILAEEIPFLPGTPLTEVVASVPGHEHAVQQLLAGVFLVDNVIDHLQASLPVGALLVDRQGQRLDWRGCLTGGTTSTSDSGLLRRKRQLEEAETGIARLEKQLAIAQGEFEELQERLFQVEEAQLAATSEKHRLELQALELAKDRQGLQAEEDRLNKRLELLIFDLEQIDEGRDVLAAEKSQLAEKTVELGERRQQLEVQSGQLQEQLSSLRSGLDQSRDELTAQRVRLASLQQQQQARLETLQRIERQKQEIEDRVNRLQQRQHAGDASREELQKKDQQLQVELEVLLDRRHRQQQESEKIGEHYEEQRTHLEEFRDQLRRVRLEAEELRKVVNQLQLNQHELQVDADHLRESVLERYRVDLLEHQVPEATEDELARQQQQLSRLQQRIESLGEVNLMAIDEYREQEERYDFLSQQRDDLNQSLDDLQKAINQINRTTRRRFKETFELVNEKFRQLFPRMFNGGQAELRLTDEDDLLETGIDIVAQPPGKRLQSVNLLSGGEKALTAVALIFSLFMIKPTPFCVLDEVDAPLDDANIDRFADIVREMTERSQFIIITHSKRTMNIVDILYGVTMQEPGVSKLVSVRVR
jgi:chromosome segregation protein